MTVNPYHDRNDVLKESSYIPGNGVYLCLFGEEGGGTQIAILLAAFFCCCSLLLPLIYQFSSTPITELL